MSGSSKPSSRRAPIDKSAANKGGTSADDCDLVFEVDLVSLRPPAAQIADGAVLNVDLVEQGNLEAVVCKRPIEQDVVGTLAAFEGLAELIDCIRRGNAYTAVVIRNSRTSCRVRVRRAPK
jgi:invasion protein IalB